MYSNTTLMGHTFAVAVVTALSLLASLPAAARPLRSETSAFALAPSASEGAQWRDDTAARAGKHMWLPFGGGGISGVHFPMFPGYQAGAGRPMLWAAGAAPVPGAFKTGGQLVQAPRVDVTRQEQAAMWASLLNPSKRPTAWLPVPPSGEAKAADAAEGTEAVDVPASGGAVRIGQRKLGA